MRFKRGNRRNKSNPIKKAMWSAKKPEDKLQNMAIMTLQKQVKALKKAPEIKFFDNTLPDSDHQYVDSSGYGPYLYPWSYIGQGTDFTQRIGDQIQPKHFHCKFVLTAGINSTDPYLVQPSIFRIIIFTYLLDESTVGLVLSDLLNTMTVNSNRNPLYLQSFKVHHDRTYVMDTNNPVREVNIRKRLSRKIRYNGISYDDTTYNTLYVLVLNNAPPMTLLPPQIEYDQRLTFTDD
nr:MAG: capsid protein [Cressdnaviricota sp.]